MSSNPIRAATSCVADYGVSGPHLSAELAAIRETRIDVPVMAFTIGVCLTAGIVCGLLPAQRARLRDLSGILKQGSKGTGAPGSHRIHNALVVAEIALALVPLIGAGLLLQSFRRLLDVAPGFQTDHVLSVQITQAAISPAETAKLQAGDVILEYDRTRIENDSVSKRCQE